MAYPLRHILDTYIRYDTFNMIPSVTYDFEEVADEELDQWRVFTATLRDYNISTKWNVYLDGISSNKEFVQDCYKKLCIIVKCSDRVIKHEHGFEGQVNYYPGGSHHLFRQLVEFHDKPPTLYSQALKICRIYLIQTKTASKRINFDLNEDKIPHCQNRLIYNRIPPEQHRPQIKLPISGRYEYQSSSYLE